MRVVGTIFWKEFKSYFLSPIAYVVLTGFTAISGFLFYQLLSFFIRITSLFRGYMVQGQVVREWSVAEDVTGPLFRNLSLFLIIMVPAITMRLFAEEKKLKTDELLLTCPIRTGEVVLGKYFASLFLLFLMLVPVGVYMLLTFNYGTDLDYGTILSGYAGLFLVAFSLASVGIFSSTLTENQIISYFVCAVLGLFFFSVGLASRSVGTVSLLGREIHLGNFLRQLSLYEHYNHFASGQIQLLDLFYFFALIILFLFASRVSFERARWS